MNENENSKVVQLVPLLANPLCTEYGVYSVAKESDKLLSKLVGETLKSINREFALRIHHHVYYLKRSL